MPSLTNVTDIPVLVFLCIADSEDPPRPTDGSVFQAELAGYVPPRGEFILEYDNYMELEVKDLSFDKDVTEEEEEYEKGNYL